jgi:HAD superfamily hydrolase (TIGR01509 family)
MNAIIFDMDGVIVDSEPLNDMHTKGHLIELGADLVARPYQSRSGMNARETWELLKAEYELEHEVEYLVQRSRQRYMEFLDTLEEIPIVDGVRELLSALKRAKYRIGLASSANPKRVAFFLEKLELSDLFEVIISGDDVEKGKPAPDCYLLAAEQLGVEPKDCVVIEDAMFGVRAAKAAGMKCLGFAGLPHNKQDLSEADVIINDFHKLASFVDEGGRLIEL